MYEVDYAMAVATPTQIRIEESIKKQATKSKL